MYSTRLTVLHLACLLGGLYAILAFSSCVQRHYYVPNAAMVPDLRQQDDLEVVLGVSDGNQLTGTEFSVAYSPVKYIGLGSRLFFSGRNGLDSNRVRYRFFQWEALAGGYYPLVEDRLISVHASAYLGFADGHITNLYGSGDQNFARLDYRRWSISPGLLFEFGPVDIAFSTRFAQFGYHKVVLHGGIPPEDMDDIDIAIDKPVFLIEPYFRFGGGTRHIRGFIALMASYPQRSIDLPFEDQMFTAGIQLRLGEFVRDWKAERRSRNN